MKQVMDAPKGSLLRDTSRCKQEKPEESASPVS